MVPTCRPAPRPCSAGLGGTQGTQAECVPVPAFPAESRSRSGTRNTCRCVRALEHCTVWAPNRNRERGNTPACVPVPCFSPCVPVPLKSSPQRCPAPSLMMCSFRATTTAGGHRGRGNSRTASRLRRRIHGARGSPAHPGCCPGSSCRERGVQNSSAPPLPRQAPHRLQCPAPTLQQSIPVSFCILGLGAR